MTASEELIRVMAQAFSALRPLLSRHLEEEGELLPYLLMGAVAEWAAAEVTMDRVLVTRLLTWLEEQFRLGEGTVKDLIGVGFVEMLPATPVGDPVLQALGPTLRQLADEFGLLLPPHQAPGTQEGY